MKVRTTIRESLISRLSNLRDNTIIIDHLEDLQLHKIERGTLIVYASWSGKAIVNCIQTMRFLYQDNYVEKILIVDTDLMTSDFQVDIFGQVCHGWGEIFIIHKGVIIKKYLGKESFENLRLTIRGITNSDL